MAYTPTCTRCQGVLVLRYTYADVTRRAELVAAQVVRVLDDG